MENYLKDIKLLFENDSESPNVVDVNEEVNNTTNKKMDDPLTQIKLLIENQAEILSKRVDMQLAAFIKSSQSHTNRRLEKIENQLESLLKRVDEQGMAFIKSSQNNVKGLREYDETVTKKMENILTETKTYNDSQIVILSKRLDMKPSQDVMKNVPSKNNNNLRKNMENVPEIKSCNKSQDLLEQNKQLIAFMKLSEGRMRRKLEENNDAMLKGMGDVIKEIRTFNEIQTEMLLESMEQHFLNKNVVSGTAQASNGKVAVEEKQEASDGLLNGDVNTLATKKRQPQINNLSFEESQGNSNEYKRIMFYIKQNLKVMILLRGLPGSGKSYLANKLLKDNFGNVNKSEFIFDPHDHLPQDDHITDEDLEAAHMTNKRECFTAVKSGISPVIVDSNNLQIEDMRVYCLMAAQNDYIIETVEVNTLWALDVSVLAKRSTLRLDEEEIQMMLESYQRSVSAYYLLKELGLNQ